MPPTPSVARFVALLAKHPLLTTAQMDEVSNAMQDNFVDARHLAKELLDRGWISPFQANRLLQNRDKELVLGPYVILERIGEGSMGQIFKARHPMLRRVCALKVIRPEFLKHPDAVPRFRREIAAVAQLAHPNIIQAFDAGQIGETHFFAMEFVEGKNLARMVLDRGALPVTEACDYIRQAALGLQHAHERGMIHRDIKPGNLLVSDAGQVKVLDMGLARLDKSADVDASLQNLTVAGTVMGTLEYMAPEQAEDSKSVDIRADIYALGCTLHFLLTRQPPFPGLKLGQKRTAGKALELPALKKRADVPPGLFPVMNKILAEKPAERYQSPAAVADALAPFCQPQAQPQPADVAAPPPPPPPKPVAAPKPVPAVTPAEVPAPKPAAVEAPPAPPPKPQPPAPVQPRPAPRAPVPALAEMSWDPNGSVNKPEPGAISKAEDEPPSWISPMDESAKTRARPKRAAPTREKSEGTPRVWPRYVAFGVLAAAVGIVLGVGCLYLFKSLMQ